MLQEVPVQRRSFICLFFRALPLDWLPAMAENLICPGWILLAKIT